MKLEVGMYVRTIKGIDKVLLVDYAEEKKQKYPNHPSKKYWRDKIYLSKERYWRTSQNIIKASNNIIDLIECLDIVELYIIGLEEDNITTIKRPETLRELKELKKYIKKGAKIKSITTKEQFEAMKYEL